MIFDWGRTLYDSDRGALFSDTTEVLEILSQSFALALVGLVSDGDVEQRNRLVHAAGLKQYFRFIRFDRHDKDGLYEEALQVLGCRPEEVAVVDDRVVRGIRWGNRRGLMTIWVRKGKFAEETPTQETGAPTHIITALSDLPGILAARPPCDTGRG